MAAVQQFLYLPDAKSGSQQGNFRVLVCSPRTKEEHIILTEFDLAFALLADFI